MYTEIMQAERTPSMCVAWKLKLPLKIKIFLWYLKKGVILTKDNLAKRRWQGSTKCCFCRSKETVQHLFFDCNLARFIWSTVFFSFGIQPPASVPNMLGSWVRGFPRKIRNQMIIGAAALCWAMWLNRNDVLFKSTITNSFLQVIFRGTYWTRTWAVLSKEEEKNEMKNCNRLEGTALEFFNKFGWNFRRRILQ